MGKENQQHFSFECPLKGTAKTLLATATDSDSDVSPDCTIDTSKRITIDGIGSDTTIGLVTLPVYIEGQSSIDKSPVMFKIVAHFHVLPSFNGRALLGIDTLSSYNIDLLISENKATFNEGSYKTSFTRAVRQTFLIRCRKATYV
ncbi:hypothetical protein DFH27DRAFT_612045 [Peziza echinospora]|nr:hypothetical protein DFH27DRAFT_612045 [Peziza echinospora]